MKEIEVNTDTLHNYAENMKEDYQSIQRDILALSDIVDSLQSMWTGPAHDVFYVQFQSDREQMDEFMITLNNVVESYEQARVEYDICEQDISGIIMPIFN